METQSSCESCQCEREARRLGEAIDLRIAVAAYAQAERGGDDLEVQRMWRVINEMDAQMQAAHQRAKALAHEHHKEHPRPHVEWLQGA